MSATVDSRVVEMRFDNSHFEKNVSTTMSTLDKLKMKLNLSGSHKGLENVGKAAKKVDMSGLANGVENVRSRFSALEVMGVTALANITNSAVNAGKRIAKSLTIDPIMSGFEEYETKMGSIQTILSNTQHAGTTMDDVISALNELNLYADKTIYNFQQMTRNVGTFTAAGLDLDTSVRSIQGIANLAAVSGSTSQQASTAMYQLSQALATGTVRLMDWNSVVNAGMGGKVFQDALIRTAAVINGASDDVDAWKKKNIDAFGSFRDSLTEGGWLTTEVLSKTLEQFTMAAEEGSEEWNKFKEALKDEGYTEAQAEAILKMGKNAQDAATKVKTYTQLMETLKESAQSGWAQTWEIIVGDFEEAKEFFGQLSEIFGGIIGDSANRRNNFLSEALMSNWDKLIAKINEAGATTTEFEESIGKVVGESKLDKLVEEFGSIEEAVKQGKISSNDLKKALDELSKTKADETVADFVAGLKEIDRVLQRGHTGEDIKKIQTALEELGYSVGAPGIDGIFGPLTEGAVKAFQAANNLKETGIVDEATLAALEKAGTKVEDTAKNVDKLKSASEELIDVITKKGGRELLLESLFNVIQAILRPIKAVGEALRNTFSIKPDQLYNALEWLSGITSKLVPKGILDSTTWADLTSKINGLGISTNDFVSKLGSVLKDHGINIDDLTKKYGSLAKAFESGAISIDYIKEALLGFDGISESLLIGGENVDKLRRTFEGLLAILDIVTTIAGGGFKIAFKVVSAVLEHFNLNILDVTAAVGDSLVAFSDWFDSIFDVGWIVEKLIPLVEKAAGAISDWFKNLRNSDAFTALREHVLGATERIKEFFESLKNSENIPGDIISGLVGGLASGIGAVWAAAAQLGQAIVDAIKNLLGIHSPSTVMIALGGFVVAGLVAGLLNGTGPVAEAVRNMLGPALEAIKNVVTPVVDLLKKINWGQVFAGFLTFTTSISSLKFANAFENLTKPLEGVNDVLDGVGVFLKKTARGVNKVLKSVSKVLKGFTRVLNATAFNIQTKGIKNLAVSLLILVGAFAILTLLDPTKLKQAYVALGVMVGVIAVLALVAKHLSNSSASFKKGEGVKVEGMITGIIAIGAAMLLLAIAIKLIGGMNFGEAVQGFLGVFALVGVIVLVLKEFTKITDPSIAHATDKMGKMLTKIGFAMLILVVVAKLIAGMAWGDMGKAAVGLFGLTMLLTTMVKSLSKLPRKNVDKVGATLLKLSVALGILVIVAKMIAGMTWGDMGKAAIGLAGLVGIVALLALIVKKIQKDAPNIGGAVLSLSGAILALSIAAKILSTITWDEMKTAGAGMAGLVVVVAVLTGIVKRLGNNGPKIAGTLLALAGAIAILAGVAVILGFVPLKMLGKGVLIVVALSLMMMGMTKMLQYAKVTKNASKAIMWLAIAIGIMAAAVVALSFIPFEKLGPAVGGMAVLMGVFTLMIRSLNTVKSVKGFSVDLKPLMVLTGVVAVMAGILFLLSKFGNADAALTSAISLSIILGVMTGVLAALKKIGTVNNGSIGSLMLIGLVVGEIGVILGWLNKNNYATSLDQVINLSAMIAAMTGILFALSKVKTVDASVIVSLALIGAVVGEMGYILGQLSKNNLTASLDQVVALSAMLLAMTGILAILSYIKVDIKNAVVGILSLTAMAVPLVALVGIFRLMKNIDNATSSANALISLAVTLVALMVPLTLLGAAVLATGGLAAAAVAIGIVALLAMCVPLLALVGILALMNNIQNAEGNSKLLIGLMNTLTDLMVKLAIVGPLASIGVSAVGSLVALIGAIGVLATAIGGIMDTFPKLKDFLDDGLSVLEQIASSLGSMIGNFIGAIGESLTDSFITMAENISTMMEKLSEASEKAATIDPASFDGVKELLDVMLDVGKTMAKTAWKDFWSPSEGTSMEQFETSGIAFFDAIGEISDAAESAGGNSEALTTVMDFAEKLIGFQSAIEPIGGIVDWFAGRDDLGKFGKNAAKFIGSMKEAMSSADGLTINSYAFDAILTGAEELAELQKGIAPIGGAITWWSGKDDLGKFGENVADFIYDMRYAFEALNAKDENGKTFEFNEDNFDYVVGAAESLVDLQSKVDAIGGIKTWWTGKNDLGTFGESVADFMTDMMYVLASLKMVDEEGNALEYSFDEDMFDDIVYVAKELATVQKKFDDVGGIKDIWTGSDSLETWGNDMATFLGQMVNGIKKINALKDVSTGESKFDTSMFDSVIAAATSMATLQKDLGPMDGFVQWWNGATDLSAFGENIKAFGDAMVIFSGSLGQITFTEDQVEHVTNAASTLKELQANLPEDKAFDGKMNLTDFAIDIEAFADAMEIFGTKVAGIDSTSIDTAIQAAWRIKGLITSMVGLDTSGIEAFTGVGTGGIGADGPVSDIAKAIAAFSEYVADIDISAVNTAVYAANLLTSIISSLVGIDPSGIENFKVSEIGSEMAAYSASMSGFNSEAVSASVSAANSLKVFIMGLAGLDTSGVGAFKTAMDELSTVDISGFISAFEGAGDDLFSPGASMVDGMIEGVQSKTESFAAAATDLINAFTSSVEANTANAVSKSETMASDSVTGVRNKYSSMYSAGTYLVSGFAEGITAQTWEAEAAAAAMAQAAITEARQTLAINSPSKVFRAIGYSVPEGFAMGIDRMSGMVKSSAADMARVAISGVSKSISRISEMVSSDIDAQPTIRPVMDLSDVASGASAINSMLGMGSTIGLSANAGAVSSMMARRSQNGANDDVVLAINKLRDKLDNVGNTYNSIGGITYDDSSNISEAVTAIVRAARMERRV